MIHIGILIYDGVEVLDCCGPFEVFTTATRIALRRGWHEAPFHVHTVALDSSLIVARGGLRLIASHNILEHPPLDIVIVPGGVTEEAESHHRLRTWLTQASEKASITASVCTGAFLLATAGLLDGHEVTTHWEDLEALGRRFPRVKVRRNVRWVDEGNILTSAGISAGMDLSLHLVQRQAGEDLAKATARQMEFEWSPGGD